METLPTFRPLCIHETYIVGVKFAYKEFAAEECLFIACDPMKQKICSLLNINLASTVCEQEIIFTKRLQRVYIRNTSESGMFLFLV